MVEFEPIKEEEFENYWKYSLESWIRDMTKAGFLSEGITDEEAKESFEEQVGKFLPEGYKSPGHHFMNILDHDLVVGTIWYETRHKGTGEAYLWDIVIYESYRGKGFGTQSLRKLEELAKQEGAKRIQLNVFGYNSVAKSMYQKAGYTEAAITMMKYL